MIQTQVVHEKKNPPIFSICSSSVRAPKYLPLLAALDGRSAIQQPITGLHWFRPTADWPTERLRTIGQLGGELATGSRGAIRRRGTRLRGPYQPATSLAYWTAASSSSSACQTLVPPVRCPSPLGWGIYRFHLANLEPEPDWRSSQEDLLTKT